MKVLIVDDEKLIRDVIKEYLLKENFEVLEAENGEEAIDMCNKHAVDLMILDIMIVPRSILDGKDLAQLL